MQLEGRSAGELREGFPYSSREVRKKHFLLRPPLGDAWIWGSHFATLREIDDPENGAAER